jgi:vanillate/3-O-methylgallate O-demethylase
VRRRRFSAEEIVAALKQRFREVTIAGRKVLPLRQGMAGEVGFELHGALADGPPVYPAILEAAADFGIRRLGHRTAMINHLEAAFPTGAWHPQEVDVSMPVRISGILLIRHPLAQ